IRIATHREARAAAGLTHPNITRVYDYGEAALPRGGLAPYLVMELVEGADLAERLTAGPLPWPDAASIAAQVAAGLAAAHAAGVVHCDIKPGNVMLTATGVKILDFGIAGLAGAASSADDGVRYGTVGYLAPERLAGADPTPAGDVYSVGVLLAEALVGGRPDSSRGVASFPVLPGVPAALTRVGAACLAADPALRPSAAELAAALADLATAVAPGRAVVAAPTTAIRRLDEPEPVEGAAVARSPMRAVAIGALAAVLVVVGIVLAIVASPSGGNTPGGGGVAQAGASPQPEAEPTTNAPEPTTPADQDDVLDEFEAALDQAVDDGKIDEKAAERIGDGLDDLRKAVSRGRDIADEARDLRSEVLRDRNKEHVDELVRRQLVRLLIPFNSAGDNEG
ncbi:MAG TPA: serine/threonine-protein kinase, partial [Asanoa sp.]|nr:serine/threonine-protein kinase [Asanoa sp.]